MMIDKIRHVDAGRVGSSQFTLQAQRIGKFKLTLSARMKAKATAPISSCAK